MFFYPATDSVVRLPIHHSSPQHPVWVPGKKALVYDVGHQLDSRLQYFDIQTKRQKSLIPYKVVSREASFTPSRHLVIFSGYDDRTGYWQIYSYDFIYGNINRLTTEKGNCRFPVFSPDGKKIAYIVHAENGRQYLKCMNWYGETVDTLSENVFGKVCWTPDSYRILYVSQQGIRFVFMSVTGDNTYKREIFSSSVPIKNPALSADGKILYLVKKNQLVKIPFSSVRSGNFSVLINSDAPADPKAHKGYPQKYSSKSE